MARQDPASPEAIRKATEKAATEEQQKPLTEKQMAKQEKDFNADERIVQRASYNDGSHQVTEYSEGNRGSREA